MIEALLCDMDGTLVHSNWLHAEAWQVTLGTIGVHVDVETLRRQIGKGGDELIPIFVPWWKRKQVEGELMSAGCAEVYESVADLLNKFEESALVNSR